MDMELPGHHVYFNDQRATFWHGRLKEGLLAAREAGKRVFLQVGRLTCGGSRALVEKTIPKDEIAEFLNAHFVCVGVDADRADADVAQLLQGLPRHEPTPVCIYLDGEGRPLHSTVGGRPAAVFLRDLTEAAARKYR